MRDSTGRRARLVAVAAAIALLVPAVGASAQAADPREGLGGGYQDAETAGENMELLAHVDRPAGFENPNNPGDFAYINSDMAFSGDHAFIGSYAGIQIWDISTRPTPNCARRWPAPAGRATCRSAAT